MVMKITTLILISLLAAPWFTQSRNPTPVSIVQLIANPRAYHGKFVRIIGFASVRFEGTAIYLHEEDYKHSISKNALWLDLDGGKSRREYLEFHERYVLVEGTFDANMKGHRSANSGSIRNIKRMELH